MDRRINLIRMKPYGRLLDKMFPVLFSIGNINFSATGVFLALGFSLGIFLIWRLARAWDLDEEKTLDLMLLTFIGGLIGARVYFAIEHLPSFAVSLFSLFLINQLPGFNFWGGFLGGWLTLYVFAKRFHLDFWQLADIASVGLLGGLILSSVGCFLGGCNVGIVSKAFFAVTQEGMLGRRWPVQVAEAVLLTFSLAKLWSQATHFHQRGKIISLGFIYIGIVKLMLEPLKQNHSGLVFSLILFLLGLTTFYRVTKQNPITHLQTVGKFAVQFITSSKTRIGVLQSLGKSWYNQKAAISWKLRNLKKLLKGSHVKFS